MFENEKFANLIKVSDTLHVVNCCLILSLKRQRIEMNNTQRRPVLTEDAELTHNNVYIYI